MLWMVWCCLLDRVEVFGGTADDDSSPCVDVNSKECFGEFSISKQTEDSPVEREKEDDASEELDAVSSRDAEEAKPLDNSFVGKLRSKPCSTRKARR